MRMLGPTSSRRPSPISKSPKAQTRSPASGSRRAECTGGTPPVVARPSATHFPLRNHLSSVSTTVVWIMRPTSDHEMKRSDPSGSAPTDGSRRAISRRSMPTRASPLRCSRSSSSCSSPNYAGSTRLRPSSTTRKVISASLLRC
jgi:hypothetical protein